MRARVARLREGQAALAPRQPSASLPADARHKDAPVGARSIIEKYAQTDDPFLSGNSGRSPLPKPDGILPEDRSALKRMLTTVFFFAPPAFYVKKVFTAPLISVRDTSLILV